jgi:uncharacterized surface anchored protein
MKNTKRLITAAAIGGAGYLIYKNWDKISNMFKKKEEEKPEETGGGSGTGSGGGTSGEKTYTDYEKKVMKLQGIVGAGIDGNAGRTENSNTNKSVKAFFPNSYAKLGIVTTANIDAYLALGDKREIADTTLADIKKRGDAIWAAMSSTKNGVIIRDGKARAVRYDSITNTYPNTGAIFIVKQGGVIKKANAVKLTDGFIVYDFYVYNLDGSNHGVRQVKIDPREINVV